MNLSGSLSENAQATLLLTSYFSKTSSDDAKPLTNAEWGRFALWLKEKSTTPADLLISEPKSLLSGWHDSRVSVERLLLAPTSHSALPVKEEQSDLFSMPAQPELFNLAEAESDVTQGEASAPESLGVSDSSALAATEPDPDEAQSGSVDFYQLFIGELGHLARTPVTLDELIASTALHKSQLTDWLKRAADEGLLKKKSRPVRYQMIKNK